MNSSHLLSHVAVTERQKVWRTPWALRNGGSAWPSSTVRTRLTRSAIDQPERKMRSAHVGSVAGQVWWCGVFLAGSCNGSGRHSCRAVHMCGWFLPGSAGRAPKSKAEIGSAALPMNSQRDCLERGVLRDECCAVHAHPLLFLDCPCAPHRNRLFM
mmetsp:Transcript_20002/g.53458  ORF Transcript_20002/g.53458 Transcript_20002/m.53458 type:complete len:156 (+) Transcript_20002:419-886(+)